MNDKALLSLLESIVAAMCRPPRNSLAPDWELISELTEKMDKLKGLSKV